MKAIDRNMGNTYSKALSGAAARTGNANKKEDYIVLKIKRRGVHIKNLHNVTGCAANEV